MEFSFDSVTLPALFFLALLTFPLLYYIEKAVKGEDLKIRKIPGMAAFDEALGRATEVGRPICFTTGLAYIEPVSLAAISILGHISRLCARYDTKVFVPLYDAMLMGLTAEVCKTAYRSEGELEMFNSDESLVYITGDQFAYASGVMGLIHREKVAAHFMFGSFAAEALILAEAGQQVGAIQIAGTVTTTQIPFFITTCDYTIIGEEFFAACAYLTREPVLVGSLFGQDRVKMSLLVVIIVGIIIATATATTDPNSSWLSLILSSK